MPILHSLGLIIPGQFGWRGEKYEYIRFYSDNAGFILRPKGMLDSDHVMLWDTVGDDDDQTDFCFQGFKDGFSSEWWRDIDDTGVTVGRLFSVPAILENWKTEVLLSSLLR